MKALRKKYGKRRWEDTPNSQWYRKRCNRVNFARSVLLGATSGALYSQLQTIRSAPAFGAFDKTKKAIAISKLSESQANIIDRIFRECPMPDPNNARS